MPRIYENLTRHNILLNAGDIAWLQATYPSIGAAAIIRTLIQRHRREIDKQLTTSTSPSPGDILHE